MPRRSLLGRRILVTGASSGIGREVAKQLVRSGSKVLCTARREQRLLELQQELASGKSIAEGSFDFLAGDLTDANHRRSITDWISSHWGGVDALINNAGNGAIGNFADASEERLRKILEVNFFAAAEMTRIVIPWLRKGDQPAIVNIGSVLAMRGVPRKSEYCAAKFALRGWSESLRVELSHEAIDVLQVHPSTTSSEFFDALTETAANEKSSSVGSMQPAAVAKSILKSIEKNRREVFLSPGGKVLVWASKRFPNWIDWVLKRYG